MNSGRIKRVGSRSPFGPNDGNLSYLAHGLSKEAIWDMEDEELQEATRKHVEYWRSNWGTQLRRITRFNDGMN